MKICSIENCGRIHYGRTFCFKHYCRWWRNGDPLRKLIADSGAGSISTHGYKVFCINGEDIYEHRRVMEEFLKRKLDRKEVVHHINHNKLDNRISNLQVLSQKEHMRTHLSKGKITDTHKECLTCREFLPYSYFYLNRNQPRPDCKICHIKKSTIATTIRRKLKKISS